MAGLFGGLENVLGINTTAGTDELRQALAALQAVGVPTSQELTLPELQKYVSAGVLSPAQYQAISENPQAYSDAIAQNQDLTGQNAQKAALQQLGGIVQAGGSTPIMQAQLANNLAQTNQANKAAREGVQENAQERGVAGGGQEFLGQLLGEQGNATAANLGAVNAGANNAQLALQALANQGNLASTLQGQSNQSAQAQAQAAEQIARYNSQLQSQANQYNTQNANTAQAANLANAQALGNANTGLANQRTQYNAEIPQQIFNDQMQKAKGVAGAYGNQSDLAQNQAAANNQFIGGMLRAGATSLGDYMQAPKAVPQYGGANGPNPKYNTNQYSPSGYAHGGIVEEKSNMQMPLQAPTSGQEAVNQMAQHTPGKIQEILHGIGNFAKNMPVKANIRPGHIGLSYEKRFAQGGEVGCYAEGGEVHDHRLCMQAGGTVPGDDNAPPMQDNEENDTIPANLSPHEIVLPRSVAQAPNAPDMAAQFVGQIKGQMPTQSFSDVIKMLEANGLELRLTSGDSNAL